MSEELFNESDDIGAGNVSTLIHDIRGCIHSIRMGREVLERSFSDDRLTEVCQAIAVEERKALGLLRKLVALVGKEDP